MKYILVGLVIAAFGIIGITTYFIHQSSTKQSSPVSSDEVVNNSHGATHSNTDIGPEEDFTTRTTVAIDIVDFSYSAPNIRIKKGTLVTWINRDTIQHNVMGSHKDEDHAHDAPKPEEVVPDHFAGPLQKKGESYSFMFNEVGTFPYHCAPHPEMRGNVTVVD